MNIFERIQHTFLVVLGQRYALDAKQRSAISFVINCDKSRQKFGDLSTNAALILERPAEEIIALMLGECSLDIASIQQAGPGFINITLSPNAYTELVKELCAQQRDFFSQSSTRVPARYSIEFVSANPTGPLHIGHGRGAIIGDVLSAVLRFLGHQVTKEFYINDAGSQIDKLGRSLRARCLQLLGYPDSAVPEDGYQGEYLITCAEQCIAEYGKDTLLQAPDTLFAEYARNRMLEGIKKTLADYGVLFDIWFSEKTLHESGAVEQALLLLEKKGFAYWQDGALWFASTRFGDDKDRVLKKESGEPTYVAADVAYLINKIARGFEKFVMVLGQDHHSYETRLKAVMAALGENPDHLLIILYQLVTLKASGEYLRMSKRAGTGVSLDDIIATVGKDVARFFYLHRKADAHLNFDVDLACKHSDENPVYYIQYAYVRTGSMLAKARELDMALLPISAKSSAVRPAVPAEARQTGRCGPSEGWECFPEGNVSKGLTNGASHELFWEESEYPLIKKIVLLKQVLADIERHRQTHLLAYYVLELAQLFHAYYGAHRVIDPSNLPQTARRLVLIEQLRMTFGLCLDLLGITKPEMM